MSLGSCADTIQVECAELLSAGCHSTTSALEQRCGTPVGGGLPDWLIGGWLGPSCHLIVQALPPEHARLLLGSVIYNNTA